MGVAKTIGLRPHRNTPLTTTGKKARRNFWGPIVGASVSLSRSAVLTKRVNSKTYVLLYDDG